MTPELRDGIVSIKHSLIAKGVYPAEVSSMDVYTAVLSGGIRDAESFEIWRAK